MALSFTLDTGTVFPAEHGKTTMWALLPAGTVLAVANYSD